MGTLKIVENGFSCYHIVTSFFADECERYAASQLQKYIYESTNTLIPYFSDICESRGREILIGCEARNAKSYIDEERCNSLGEEGFIIKTSFDGNIVICGKTSRCFNTYFCIPIYKKSAKACKTVEKYYSPPLQYRV